MRNLGFADQESLGDRAAHAGERDFFVSIGAGDIDLGSGSRSLSATRGGGG